jgi:hypothetical protein
LWCKEAQQIQEEKLSFDRKGGELVRAYLSKSARMLLAALLVVAIVAPAALAEENVQPTEPAGGSGEVVTCPLTGPGVIVFPDRLYSEGHGKTTSTITLPAGIQLADVVIGLFDDSHRTNPYDDQTLENGYLEDVLSTDNEVVLGVEIPQAEKSTVSKTYRGVDLSGMTTLTFVHVDGDDDTPNSLNACVKFTPAQEPTPEIQVNTDDFCVFDTESLATTLGVEVEISGGEAGTTGVAILVETGQTQEFTLPGASDKGGPDVTLRFENLEETDYTVKVVVGGQEEIYSGTVTVTDDCTPGRESFDFNVTGECAWDGGAKTSVWFVPEPEVTEGAGFDTRFSLVDPSTSEGGTLIESFPYDLLSSAPGEIRAEYFDPVWGWSDGGVRGFDPEDDCTPEPVPFEHNQDYLCVPDDTGRSTFPFVATWTEGIDAVYTPWGEEEPLVPGQPYGDGSSFDVHLFHADPNLGLLDDGLITMPAVASCDETGSIGDYVWYDVDDDGVQDSDEAGVTGVTVRVTDQATGEVFTDVTDVDGYYLVDGLYASTYLVEVLTSTFPDNYGLTTTGSYTITLSVGEDFLDADFGIVKILPVTGLELGQVADISGLLLLLGGAFLGLERLKKSRKQNT